MEAPGVAQDIFNNAPVAVMAGVAVTGCFPPGHMLSSMTVSGINPLSPILIAWLFSAWRISSSTVLYCGSFARLCSSQGSFSRS